MPNQPTLFPDLFTAPNAPKPVNVSKVPLRSPFRYPGGKTWFVPAFREWIGTLPYKPSLLIEPFVGGGIISLTALFENLVERAIMVELDDDVAAVWQAVANGKAEWLAERILEFNLTRESLAAELDRKAVDIKERAFQTILKNRTYHGGILADGSGLIKHGESGKGIRSRWYPTTLARRFRELQFIAPKIDFRQTDGLEVIKQFSDKKDAVFFIDPPYTAGGKKAGRRLYRHCDLDHEQLFELCKSIKGDFIMTYDDAAEVKAMAHSRGLEMRLIPMTNTHHTTMLELVIGKNLAWMDRYPAVCEPKAPYFP